MIYSVIAVRSFRIKNMQLFPRLKIEDKYQIAENWDKCENIL